MNQFLVSLTSVALFIGMGLLARRMKLLDVETGRKLFKFLFTFPLPLLVFTSFASNPVQKEWLVLPLIGGLVAVSLLLVSYLVGRAMKLNRKSLGTLMTASGITSTLSFALPFITVFYGQEATRYLFLYDFGGAIIVWTVVYYLAGWMGNKRDQKLSQSLQTYLKNPMLWALVLGLMVGLSGVTLPPFVKTISQQLSGLTNPLILIGIGIFLNLEFFKQKSNLVKIFVGAVVAMGVSLGLAYLLTNLFGVTGIAQKVVLICALAPSGSLTVPFAVEHGLDTDYASALVAATMFFALLLVPVLILV